MKIRTKLILTFSFFVISFLIFGILISIIFDKEAREHALIHTEIYSHTFALTIGRETEKDKTPPLFFNREALEDYIQDAHSIQNIDISVVDTAKTIAADVIKSEIGKKYSYDKNNEVLLTMQDGLDRTFKEVSSDYPGGIFLYVHPIKTEKGKTLGAVLIEYTATIKEAEADINKVRQIVLYAILFLIFVAIAFGFVISKIITGAISDLVNAARKFSQGNYSVRIKTERKDELGELGKAFNLMAGQKQKSDEQILLLSNAIKSADEMISITDINNKFLFVNDAFCRGYGYTQEETIGKYIELIRSEKNDVELLNHIQLLTLDYGWHGELWNKTKNGNDFLIELHTSPVKNAKGEKIALVGIANDITKRKEAEERLKESEKKFREFADFLPQPVFEYDTKGVFTFANRASFEATGYTPDDVGKGLTVFNLIDPQQQQILIEMMKKRFNRITSGGIEYNIIRKDGSSFPAITYSSLIEINGEIKGVRGIIIDITRQRKYEATLRQNAAQLKLLNDIGSKIASSLDIDVIMDRAVKLVHENFNCNHVSLLTYNVEEDYLIVKSIAGAFVNLFVRDKKIYLEKGMIIWAARTGNIAVANDVSIDPYYVNVYPDMINTRSELCIPLKIGTKVFGIFDLQCPKPNAFSEEDINVLTTLADQISLAINNSLLYESIQHELREKIKAEEALKESEEKYRLVFTNVPLGIVHYNSKGIVTDCNDVFLEILGITKEDALGFNIIRIEDLKYKEAYELAFSGIIGNYEGDYKPIVSKKIISLKISFAPIVHEDGKILGVVGIFEDVSERKQIERFFFHDILNTAGNLKNCSELINDNSLEKEDKDHFTKQILIMSNQIIEEIISHRVILSSDKTELKLNIVALNTLEFIKNIIINFKQMADKENKQISISDKFEDLEIKTDRVLLSRIISNLIKNAIEASQTGGIISVGCSNGDGLIKLSVHNQTEIPEEIQPKIFHRSFSTKGAGRGIGTYSLKFLTEKYLNGKVFFTSNGDDGTTFYVNIPSQI